jgi:hypothetical protein
VHWTAKSLVKTLADRVSVGLRVGLSELGRLLAQQRDALAKHATKRRGGFYVLERLHVSDAMQAVPVWLFGRH